ncbi:MAG: aldo/keto reductase [Pseudomonadales bacterium]|nr:aldo/keto reductase [Pseudomonadales bacterium]MDP6472291.1 aldo/keto reductase [Pseudomonadales bacterium]MDP6828087.1 aldo/keto reductase [Pseudomonadales bacterium]MDP6972551.1 aldo/keto reductase [Pseudomonadales bacterium]
MLDSSNRRTFMQKLAMLGVGAQALLSTGSVKAAVAEAKGQVEGGLGWPEMTYRILGRTGFEGSRLFFGCGASLARRPRDELLNVAFDAGVNVFDVGTGRYYGDAERNLAPFVRKHRDDIFVISKGYAQVEDVGPNDPVTPAQAKQAAAMWQTLMDESLRDLEVDGIDAYYQMAANNPNLTGSEEMRMTFEKARDAGKVKHWGLSTHQNAQAVLAKAVETGWYDLAMIAITPGGWYDWDGKSLLAGTPPMTGLKPQLEAARESGMVLVGMKVVRHIAGRNLFGWGDETAFDEYYDESLLKADLSAFQRSYAYVLEHGVDAVNADIQNFLHLRENFTVAATSGELFANKA